MKGFYDFIQFQIFSNKEHFEWKNMEKRLREIRGEKTKLEYEALMIKRKLLPINKCWHDFKNVCNLGEKVLVH